jgi:H2-forming N5,N10-methylenetetrahydromethanopterin dehydrogenase-like enzyme
MDWTKYVGAGLSLSGLLALAIVLILRGSLVPRSTLDMVRTDRDREVETYKAIIAARDRTIDAQQVQIAMLLDGNRTTQRVVEAVGEAARFNREGGGGNALAQAPAD